MKPFVSILISTYNRTALFRRTLWALVNRPPSRPYEVVVADDGSGEDVLAELKAFGSSFLWAFIEVDAKAFDRETGIKRYFNCPALTSNVAARHARADLIFQQGQEVIPWGGVYDALLAEIPETENFLLLSTTYDLPRAFQMRLDEYGSNLTENLVQGCQPWPLQSEFYRSDVTNYLSLTTKAVFEQIGGYDENYLAGIGAEDSDFVQRAQLLPGFVKRILPGVSLHQDHGGKTRYQDPSPDVISGEVFEAGCKINRARYHAWKDTIKSSMTWPWGTLGVKNVIRNFEE